MEKRVLLSENSSVVSAQRGPGVRAGILKLMRIRLTGFTFLTVVDSLSPIVTLNGRNIQIVNTVTYLGVIINKKFTWRVHIEIIAAKAFRIFIRIYSL
jgi:hypothetical protein